MKKIIAIILALVMVLALAGCSDNGQKTIDAIVGDWYYTYDITDKMMEQMTDVDKDVLWYFNFHDLKIALKLSIDAEGNYTLIIDEATTINMAADLKRQVLSGMSDYLTAYMSKELGDEELSMLKEMYGADDPVQLIELVMGIKMEDYVNESIPFDSIVDEFKIPAQTGKVTAQKLDLTFTGTDGGTDTGVYDTTAQTITIKLTANELGITEMVMKR